MKKEEFKEFVRKNPKLINYVKRNEMTWQKFYEMYDLYGEDNSVWNTYLNSSETSKVAKAGIAGIGNVQRVIGVVQDFSKKDTKTSTDTYKPRPLYKHFED